MTNETSKINTTVTEEDLKRFFFLDPSHRGPIKMHHLAQMLDLTKQGKVLYDVL